jgi:hypothetical protein
MDETAADRASDNHAEDPADPQGALDQAPGLARIYAGAWLRTAGWTAGLALRTGLRLGEAAVSPQSAARLADEARDAFRAGARAFLDATGIESPFGSTPAIADESEPLRERGAELLSRSAELDDHGDGHPAFDRILAQLAPDEARILRLLATEGPQAAVDVRTWRPFGIGSRVVAPGLSMIGRNAGCMRPDRVPAYLANLFRLGLIWFSHDPVSGLERYQVLEAQPDVIEAMKGAGRASTVRRSIRLTPFGLHFCDFCLPIDTAEFAAVIGSEGPDGAATIAEPDDAVVAAPEA